MKTTLRHLALVLAVIVAAAAAPSCVVKDSSPASSSGTPGTPGNMDPGTGGGGKVSEPTGGEGQTCLTDADCASGICEGEGCGDDAPGTCAASADRVCTRDLAIYCGCDGQTFNGSGSCPGARYAHRGQCP